MNAIVLMAIGDKYLRLFDATKDQFARYAEKCNAELIVCKAAPDPTFKRNILCQKMLLPALYAQYEWIAFLDLDILISENAPSIFDKAEESKAFAAVADLRGSKKFENVVKHYWHAPNILDETHASYFFDRGFPAHDNHHLSINGGVWLCQPKKIAEKFKEFYYSNFKTMPHEEAIMAFVAQSNDLFYELDYKYNTQLMFEIYDSQNSLVIEHSKSFYFKCLRKFHCYLKPSFYIYPNAYKVLINQLLSKSYIVHFSGGFPFVNSAKNRVISRG